MIKNNRKAKIVATLGPASETPEKIEELLKAGVNVIRLNLSHGDMDAHDRAITSVRDISERLDLSVAILIDLQGPRIRIGSLKKSVPVKAGERLTITVDGGAGKRDKGAKSSKDGGAVITTTYEALADDVLKGSRILIDDGLIELKVTGVTGSAVHCEVINGGEVKTHKGMNLPGVKISAPALTDRDIEGIGLAVLREVDYLALSFVRRPEDVLELKRLLKERDSNIAVIAKIEKAEAVNSLAGILDVSEGVMIARGDLGVELSAEKVPILQKNIIQMANEAEKIVITATQMLESMIKNPRPTRAEASDVANAVFDGTDALMLSGETAVGKHPIKAVEMMSRIIVEAEEAESANHHRHQRRDSMPASFAHMICLAAYSASAEGRSSAIVVYTQTGDTAMILSKLRPGAPVVAFTPLIKTCRRLALVWGVQPFRIEYGGHTDEMICRGESELINRGLANWGDTVVIVSGTKVGMRGATNMMKIDWLGSEECRIKLEEKKDKK
jgi:pyruvate kinase